MAEDRLTETLNPVADIPWLALVTFDAVFVGGNAEGLDT
jgi:hypothetical protein